MQNLNLLKVATVLTVYGIETEVHFGILRSRFSIVATVLTVYGIETISEDTTSIFFGNVATVLTVYGIETRHMLHID